MDSLISAVLSHKAFLALSLFYCNVNIAIENVKSSRQVSNPNPSPANQFKKTGRPTLAKKIIGVRLSPEMDALVRSVAGQELSEWVRCAIAEKLERDLSQSA